MTMQRFMLDGFQSEEDYAKLAASAVFPLVREMEFKYGLKVVRSVRVRAGERMDTMDAWLLAHKNGLATGLAFMNPVHDQASDKPEFCYRTPFYSKARGKNLTDRQTIRSTKVSSLMATLTKQKGIPTADELAEKTLGVCQNMPRVMRMQMGDSQKSHRFTSDEIHALLLMALGESPKSEKVAVDLNKCKNTLDLFEKADTMEACKRADVMSLFANPFFVSCVDEAGDYIIGKFKANVADHTIVSSLKALEFMTIEPFKRYKTYQDVPEIIPVMTMVKQVYETERNIKGMPVTDAYNADLQAVFYYDTSPSLFDYALMATPCL